MTKRMLNTEELGLATKMLTKRKEEVEWLEYQLEYHDLMLRKGLEENYKKVLREYKLQRADYEKELAALKDIINTLQHQIREGVEIKEEVVEETAEKEVE